MEQGKSNVETIVLTIIITAAVVGSGVYLWQKNQPDQQTQTVSESSTKAPANNSDQSSPQFSTIDKYVYLVMYAKTASQYETSQPNGLTQIKDVTPEGVDFFVARVWAKSANTNTFYIETIISAPESSEETHTWYGPFTGDVNLLIK